MQYKHPICQKYFDHTEMEINTKAHFFHLPTPFIRKLLENVLYQKKNEVLNQISTYMGSRTQHKAESEGILRETVMGTQAKRTLNSHC